MFQVKKRDGKLVEYDMSKISIAISKAFNAKGVKTKKKTHTIEF